MLELFMGQHTKDVALVLGPVCGAVELAVAVRVLDHLRVMPGADSVESEGDGLFQQGGELDALVAPHAGAWGAAGGVFADEVLDHVSLEPLREGPHVVRAAENAAGAPGVAGVLDGAAAAASRAEGARHP